MLSLTTTLRPYYRTRFLHLTTAYWVNISDMGQAVYSVLAALSLPISTIQLSPSEMFTVIMLIGSYLPICPLNPSPSPIEKGTNLCGNSLVVNPV